VQTGRTHWRTALQVGRTVDTLLLRLGHSARQAVGQAEPPPAPKLACVATAGHHRLRPACLSGYDRATTVQIGQDD
jgi:hypothetical protein